MSWLEFFSSVISSLAWPAAVVAIVIVLRKSLRQLLLNLKRVKGWGGEAEFGERVETAEAVAATEPELAEAHARELSPGPTGVPALSSQLAYEIHRHPRAAVIEAWIAVERELNALAQVAGIDPGERRWTMAVIGQLREQGVITPALASVLTELKQARNIAAHIGPNPLEGDEVVEYVKLAGRVRDALRVAQERLRAEGGHSGDDGLG